MKALKTVRKIHLYLGLTCGLVVSISGLTGSLYVWQPEITAALNPDLLQTGAAERLPEEVLLKTSADLYEAQKDSIAKIFLPYRGQQTIGILYEKGQTLYYHPQTGELLGEPSASIAFFEELLKFHRGLGIPEVGKYVVGGSALLFFLFLLTSGFVLWWKKYRSNFKKGIRIRWKRNKKRINYDLHKSLGFFFFLPLAVMAFSGAYFTYHSYFKEVLKSLDADAAAVHPEETWVAGRRYEIGEMIRTPHRDYVLWAVYLPVDGKGEYQFRYIRNRYLAPGFRKTSEVKLDATGRLIQAASFHQNPVSEQLAAQFYPVHIGEIAGLAGRILVFVSGFIPLVLFITGLRFFYWKNRKKYRSFKGGGP